MNTLNRRSAWRAWPLTKLKVPVKIIPPLPSPPLMLRHCRGCIGWLDRVFQGQNLAILEDPAGTVSCIRNTGGESIQEQVREPLAMDSTLNIPVPRLIRMIVCDWAQNFCAQSEVSINRVAFVIFLYDGVYLQSRLDSCGTGEFSRRRRAPKYQRNSIIGNISVYTHTFTIHAAISYYFRLEMNRLEICLHNKCTGLYENVTP